MTVGYQEYVWCSQCGVMMGMSSDPFRTQSMKSDVCIKCKLEKDKIKKEKAERKARREKLQILKRENRCRCR